MSWNPLLLVGAVIGVITALPVSYTHLRAHETRRYR